MSYEKLVEKGLKIKRAELKKQYNRGIDIVKKLTIVTVLLALLCPPSVAVMIPITIRMKRKQKSRFVTLRMMRFGYVPPEVFEHAYYEGEARAIAGQA